MKCSHLIIFIAPVAVSRKILSSESPGSSAEIMNSSVRDLDDFTICGRFFSHIFSSSIQTFLHIGIGNEEYALGLGTWPGYPCEDFYDGNRIIKLNFYSFLYIGCTDFMTKALGNDYRRGSVYGTLFVVPGESGDQLFEVWTLGIWHSFCILTSVCMR